MLPALTQKKKGQEEDEAGPKAPVDPETGQPRERPVPPSTRGAPPQAQRPAQASTTRPPSGGESQRTGGSIENALEEIRARVREAQLQEDARQRRTTTAQRPTEAERSSTRSTGGSLVSGEARRIRYTGTAPTGTVLGPQAPRTAPPPRSASGRSGAPGQQQVAAPLEVERRRDRPKRENARAARAPQRLSDAKDALHRPGAPAATLSAPFVTTDKASIVKGMIWHVILSEPAAKKRLRRTRSPHPLR